MSRLWAGVHFLDSILEAKRLCTPIGTEAYHYIQSLIDGTYVESQEHVDSSSNDSQ